MFDLIVATLSADTIVGNLRDFIAPIVLFIIGFVALSFLFRRQISAFIQFFILTVLVGVLFYVPNIIETIARFVVGLLGLQA